MVRKGDRVQVLLAGGERVERRVWGVTEDAVLICTSRGYEDAERSGGKPSILGFRREYVEPAKPEL